MLQVVSFLLGLGEILPVCLLGDLLLVLFTPEVRGQMDLGFDEDVADLTFLLKCCGIVIKLGLPGKTKSSIEGL